MQQPISVSGLKSWLELQDPKTEYDYWDSQDCLLCRYFKSVGLPVGGMGGSTWFDSSGDIHRLPDNLDDIVCNHPRIYASALERCNTALAEQKS